MTGPASAVRRLRAAALVLALVAGLAACVQEDADRRTGSPTEILDPPDPPEVEARRLAAVEPGRLLPLREGEQRMSLTMEADYTPSPGEAGTDDYRCFLLDPELDRDVWLTGSNVLPGNPDVVHHVILFRIEPGQVAAAEAKDEESEEPGWTCFGGTGLDGDFTDIDDAGWLGAWAPGSDEDRTRDGYGLRMEAGSRIVMQVHYNTLRGAAPDRSTTQLRWMAGKRALTPIRTYLLPAPVELPCRPDRDASPLCDRETAVADVVERFGSAGNTNSLLHLLCGTEAEPSNTATCTRTVGTPMEVIGVAGHMHLLGRRIRVDANPGTDRARRLLDIPVWDFDDQATKPIDAVELQPFDTLRVTCVHQQWLRDRLPAFAGQPDRYVIWAEGSTDEMCLAILQVADLA